MSKKYSLGIDFGTLSVRAALFDTRNGAELGTTVVPYEHAVLDHALPDGTPLPQEYALQDVLDYRNALDKLIPAVMRSAGVPKEDVISIGLDFTACTILPVKKDGMPLCIMEKFRSTPHAWVKLWKHHGAMKYVTRITELAEKMEPWITEMYGGRISPESLLCKTLEIYCEAPEVIAEADYIIEACDYVTWMLTGVFHRSEAAAGICGCWRKGHGYPSRTFLDALTPGFGTVVEKKLAGEHLPIGSSVGTLLPVLAKRWGLSPQTVVATALVDSQAAVPGAGISAEGKMMATMGTSTVYMLLGRKPVYVSGMGACSQDTILPGYYGYSAGQSCVGDQFAWVIDHLVPGSYYEAAKKAGMNIHAYLRKLASVKKPGEHGLLALDWWNGNRCVLTDMDLTGMILGFRLNTCVEDVYRALIEATAYGARRIADAFRESGVDITEMYASGGIPMKDEMMMQIYADVLQMPIRICGSSCGPMLGAAILATLAAGTECGGFDSIDAATDSMAQLSDKVYTPIQENAVIYDELYSEYLRLHDYFGRGENNVMKHLLAIKKR